MSPVASLDLGTNTFRLLIAEFSEKDGLIPVVIKRAITRLGEGLYENDFLNPSAIKKSLSVIDGFSSLIKQHQVEKVFAVSTSVLRDAKNSKEFTAEVFKQTGISVRILTGVEEAELTLKGVLSVLDCIPLRSMVFDIGGGSTEFILTEGSIPNKTLSVNLGVVHLAEKFLISGSMTSVENSSLNKYIKDIIEHTDFKYALSAMLSSHASPAQSSLIGTAGTVTTLAAIAQQMEHYAPEKINNYILSRQTIENIYHRLTLSSLEERKEITGLEEGREAIIVPGVAIVLEIMNHFGFNQITVSDAGLLEGILLADCMEITDFKSL